MYKIDSAIVQHNELVKSGDSVRLGGFNGAKGFEDPKCSKENFTYRYLLL